MSHREQEDRIATRIVACYHLAESDPSMAECRAFLDSLLLAVIHEQYLPYDFSAVDASVLEHLSRLPDIEKMLLQGEREKAIKTVRKLCARLSNPKHPVSKAMKKMKELPIIKMLEEQA